MTYLGLLISTEPKSREKQKHENEIILYRSSFMQENQQKQQKILNENARMYVIRLQLLNMMKWRKIIAIQPLLTFKFFAFRKTISAK